MKKLLQKQFLMFAIVVVATVSMPLAFGVVREDHKCSPPYRYPPLMPFGLCTYIEGVPCVNQYCNNTEWSFWVTGFCYEEQYETCNEFTDSEMKIYLWEQRCWYNQADWCNCIQARVWPEQESTEIVAIFCY